jgi:hypothetical protein
VAKMTDDLISSGEDQVRRFEKRRVESWKQYNDALGPHIVIHTADLEGIGRLGRVSAIIANTHSGDSSHPFLAATFVWMLK